MAFATTILFKLADSDQMFIVYYCGSIDPAMKLILSALDIIQV